MTARIEDYAMIGDCRTAALICRNGSIDWLCVPRFDSEACFAALLGTKDNGRWLIEPVAKKFKTSRRYLGDSLILETLFEARTGAARVIDFMPPGTPDCAIVRIVECVRGHIDMRTELAIRFDYGVTIPWVTRRDTRTLTAVAGPQLLTIRTPVQLYGENMHTEGKFSLRKGEAMPFVLAYGQSFKPVPMSIDAFIALDETERYWQRWSAICKVKGRWRKAIMRSLLTLKGLSYEPTGGIVAAVTTSLPEKIGSTRNWDYRYCWLRDATFTLLAFLNAGYTEEATSWLNWLMRVIAGAPEQIQTMYTVLGDKRLDELELPHLPGYENSRPVRIGNAAHSQLQLDIYGELGDVGAQARAGGLPSSARGKEIRRVFMGHLEKIWRKPDEGIWEIRGQPQHFVHSKVMTWVAFDRASRAPGSTAQQRAHWKKTAREIHRDICKNGLDRKLGCFVQAYGSRHMDASLLLLPLVGFLPPSDPRIKATVKQIEKRLLHKGLVQRYETETGVDGLPPGEGAFLACSFWLADNYALMGRRKEAMRLFNKLSRLANDVGLYAEEYDPDDKRMLGNFPQAFSHVALINNAINLMTNAGKKKGSAPVPAAEKKPRRILCIDVGGSGLKATVISPRGAYLAKRVRIKTPKHRKPRDIVKALAELAAPLGVFDHVTVGFPGMVKNGKVISAPHFGTKDWKGFDLAAAMRKQWKRPVKLLNDADVQGLAVIEGKGLELVCTLGTGFGTAWFRDGELMPHMDLAHLAVHKKYDLDVYVGDQTRRKMGDSHWNRRVKKLITVLETVFGYDQLYLGGGNSRWVKFRLPRNVTIVSNDAGMEGGAFAWRDPKK